MRFFSMFTTTVSLPGSTLLSHAVESRTLRPDSQPPGVDDEIAQLEVGVADEDVADLAYLTVRGED
jgi:hypothetical protein